MGTHDLQLEGLLVDLDRAEALYRVGWGGVDGTSAHGVDPSKAACSTYEVDADGRDVRVREGVVGEAEQEAGLAHARVPDQHELEEEVVIALRHAAGAGVGGGVKWSMVWGDV